MKKITEIYPVLLSGVIVLGFLFSCSRAEELKFTTDASVSFRMPRGVEELIISRDTIIYSFAFEAPDVKEYLLNIPVEIIGKRENRSRTFSVNLVAGKFTTAEPGKDYEQLSATYTIPAGEGEILLPVKLFRSENVAKGERWIHLTFTPTTDFGVGIIERNTICIRFSDLLEKPTWWSGMYEYMLGAFSRVKYQYWLDLWGREAPPSFSYAGANPKEAYAIEQLKLYFDNNPTLDENNELIYIPGL